MPDDGADAGPHSGSGADSGPSAEEIRDWIVAAYPDTVVATAMNATFFSLSENSWPNFATIVTTDEHDVPDTPSRLSRPGVFRLNIGVSRQTFDRLVGDQLAAGAADYATLDRIIPHPVYAKQHWLAILNPTRRSFEALVKPLIAEAHERVASSSAARRPDLPEYR